MKFTEKDLPFLKGEEFSNGRKFIIANSNAKNSTRFEYLIKLTARKRIIHFGFADHIPLIKNKIDKKKWLHKLLIENAKFCVGIDIDSNSVNYLKNEYSIDNIYPLNIEKDEIPNEISDQKFDYLILGEVLEHTDNPVLFLRSIHEKFNDIVEKIIITVPNAYDINSLNQIRYHKEFINTDHRFWFTPFTLAKVLSQSGFSDFDFDFSQTFFPNSKFQKYILKKYPATRETLIMTAKF
jgi:hypothetical protein